MLIIDIFLGVKFNVPLLYDLLDGFFSIFLIILDLDCKSH